MSTFRDRLNDVCGEVASEFESWQFSSGAFKNKALKHATLSIDPCFAFDRNGSTPLQPAIFIHHKKSMALFKKINGYELPTSVVPFQNVAQLLTHMPENLRLGASIVDDKGRWLAKAKPSEQVQDRWVDISEARSIMRSVLLDGIDLLETFYDFSSEESFLRHFPPRYSTRNGTIPYDEFERNKGVMVCIVRALTGDFDFIDKYRSDDYPTLFPKRVKELGNIAAALPELKRLYAEKAKIG